MLQAEDIQKVYKVANKAIHVLRGVDLKIERGKFIAVVGPSGAGKSTLLHILGGLDLPTKGKVIFGGEDLSKLSDTALCKIRNQRIGFVFQFYHLLPEFTVLENVLLPRLISQEPLSKSKEQAGELLKQAGLEQRLRHFPNQLSGGEQQRVAVVRALINQPALLLCDEPTGNLDTSTGGEIIALIKKISQDNRMTVVLVTHNLELTRVADCVYHLKDGVLVS